MAISKRINQSKTLLKHSGYGIAALIVALSSIVLNILDIALGTFYQPFISISLYSGRIYFSEAEIRGFEKVLSIPIVTILAFTVGLPLIVTSLLQKNRNRKYLYYGLICYLLIIIFTYIMGISFIDTLPAQKS